MALECSFRWNAVTGLPHSISCAEPAAWLWTPNGPTLTHVYYSCDEHYTAAIRLRKSSLDHYTVAPIDAETGRTSVPVLRRQRVIRQRRQNVPIDEAD